eukprot:403334925
MINIKQKVSTAQKPPLQLSNKRHNNHQIFCNDCGLLFNPITQQSPNYSKKSQFHIVNQGKQNIDQFKTLPVSSTKLMTSHQTTINLKQPYNQLNYEQIQSLKERNWQSASDVNLSTAKKRRLNLRRFSNEGPLDPNYVFNRKDGTKFFYSLDFNHSKNGLSTDQTSQLQMPNDGKTQQIEKQLLFLSNKQRDRYGIGMKFNKDPDQSKVPLQLFSRDIQMPLKIQQITPVKKMRDFLIQNTNDSSLRNYSENIICKQITNYQSQ